MDPYKLYTLTAAPNSEIAILWEAMQLPKCAMLYQIEDELNHYFITHNYIHVDASGVMIFRWKAHDGSTIEASPSAFRKWFFIGVQEVAQHSPSARPSTPLEMASEHHPEINVDELLAMLDEEEPTYDS